MLKIFISCAGGFSSSALVQKLKKEIIERGLSDQVQIDFSPFRLAVDDFEGYDIIMVCPHQRYQVEEYNEKYVKNEIPIYVLPTRVYGTMHLETIVEDAKSLLKLFKANPQNPIHFPGEENPLRITRTTPYIVKNGA